MRLCPDRLKAIGLVVDGEKDVSLFLDETSEPTAQQRDSSRLKNKDTSYSPSTTDPITNLHTEWNPKYGPSIIQTNRLQLL